MVFGTSHNTSQFVDANETKNDNYSHANKFDSAKRTFDINLDNKSLKRVYFITFLGVTIDQNLTWKNHIDQLML